MNTLLEERLAAMDAEMESILEVVARLTEKVANLSPKRGVRTRRRSRRYLGS